MDRKWSGDLQIPLPTSAMQAQLNSVVLCHDFKELLLASNVQMKKDFLDTGILGVACYINVQAFMP